jgi:hypothetical protein
VRGNNDKGAWAKALNESEFLQVGEFFLYAIHDLAELDIDPVAAAGRRSDGCLPVAPQARPIQQACLTVA